MRTWLAAAAVVLLSAAAASADDSLIAQVKAGDRDAALASMDAGADVNTRETDGSTAVLYAAHLGDKALIAALVAAGADVNAENNYGSTPLGEAAVLGDEETLGLLLDAGADVESPNHEGQTALMAVARTGHVDAARLLVEHGADVNAHEHWGGQTALMWAAAQHQPDMISFLIEQGADPNAQAIVRDWPRRLTSEPRIKEMHSGGLTPLLYAGREGCAECVRRLIAGGADPDIADPDGVTPLVAALLNLRFDAAKALIEGDADVDQWDWWGRTPLYAAADVNTIPEGARADLPPFADLTTGVEIIQMLLDRGANPNYRLKLDPPLRNIVYDRGSDSQVLAIGATPLLRAARAGDASAIALLVEHGADPNLGNASGITPVMAAAGMGRGSKPSRGATVTQAGMIESLRLLIAAGGDPNLRSQAGQAPLHAAVREGWNDVVRFLVEEGADVNIPDGRGLTPLDYAEGRVGGFGFRRSRDPIPALPETVAVVEELGGQPGRSQEDEQL